ncbi:MAG: BatA and WFA domain-containing protein [Planctomycetota bacterium]
MNWVAPGAFWLLALALPITALFFYRRRSLLREVPSIRFWEQSARPAAVRFFGRYFSNVPMLLVALLLLTLLVTALAGPTLPRQVRAELIVVLDTAASMQTIEDGGTTRMELARREALNRVGATSDGTLFSLITAGLAPHALLAHGADRARMSAALQSVPATDADSDLAAAIELAASLCTVGRRSEIHVLSDLAGQELPPLTTLPSGVVIHPIGQAHPNAGIVGLSNPQGTTTLEVTIASSNMPGASVTATLSTVDENGQAVRAIATESTTITKERTTLMLPCGLAPGVPFRVDLAPADALLLDNVAWGVWPEDPTVRVQLVTEGNVFLKAALASMPSAVVQVVLPQRWKPDETADITIFDRISPPHQSAAPGRYLCFGCADPFGWVFASPQAVRTDSVVTYWSADHRALEDVELESWQIRQTAGLLAPPNARMIAAADDVPVLFEYRPAAVVGPNSSPLDALAVYFNFTIGDSNLAFRPTFPILLWNALDYLLQRNEAPGTVARKTGAPLSRSRHTLEEPTITDPLRRERPMAAQGDRWTWTDTGRQGLYRLRSKGRHDEWVAFNWMSLRLTPSVPAQASDASQVVPPPGGPTHTKWWALATRSGQPWRLLLVTLVAGLLIEWLLFNRRVLKM